ncbi:MAG: hypothetical protein V1907_04410 [Candidatus Kerfeldbacteria bacterium]
MSGKKKPKKAFIRPAGGSWQEVPDPIITFAMGDLPIGVGGTEFADYVARSMGFTGRYLLEYREIQDDGSMKSIGVIEGEVPSRAPGDQLMVLPDGNELVATYVAPQEENPAP